MKHILIVKSIILMLFLISCNNSNQTKRNIDQLDTLKMKYSKGFSMHKSPTGYILELANPWQNASNIKYSYSLDTEDELSEISIPVKRVVCLSTTHIAYLDKLNELESIVGISNPGFVTNVKLRERIEAGEVADIGYEQAMNYERILELKPDVIFAFSIGAEVAPIKQKFADWNIPVVVVSEYLETHPLALAEWVKFFGAFYDKSNEADSVFSFIENNYTAYASMVENISHKPKTMVGLPWKGVWYAPGGNSYTAKYISDAGGDYLWKNKLQRENLSLSIEEVINKGQEADIWLNPNMVNTFEEVLQNDSRVNYLKVFKTKEIYNNNKIVSVNGGNDYYESATMQPHLVLRDLIKIFHPEFYKDSSFTYYKKLK